MAFVVVVYLIMAYIGMAHRVMTYMLWLGASRSQRRRTQVGIALLIVVHLIVAPSFLLWPLRSYYGPFYLILAPSFLLWPLHSF